MTTKFSTRRPLCLFVKIGILFATCSAVVFTSGVSSLAATASSTTSFYSIFSGGDQIGNYDHTGYGASHENNRSSVDWTLTMYFTVNAEIDKVKNNLLKPKYSNTGGPMYERLTDGSGWVWDQDSGLKNPNGCHVIDTHMRLYADADDQLYNVTDGFYVVASTHKDYYEASGCGTYYGRSEDASNEFLSYFTGKGYSCMANAVNVHNAEPVRYDDGGLHIWQNDGNLHRCLVP